MKNDIRNTKLLGADAIEAVVVYNGNPLIQTTYDQQMFDQLVLLMKTNPRNYAKTLTSKVFSKRKYAANDMFTNISRQELLSWIYAKTTRLDNDDFKYNLPTRCYWVITGRTDFPICPTCGNKFGMRKNFKFCTQYRSHCCNLCTKHDPNVQQYIQGIIFKKYGSIYTVNASSIRKKICNTLMQKYGVTSPAQIPGISAKFNSPDILEKINNTKLKNGTFNTSKPENLVYNKLKQIYAESDILRQFKSSRYPYRCDFYIKSHDLFIECNFHWTHGFHWFNSNDIADIQKLQKWRSKKSNFYKKAEYVWTQLDPLKRKVAEDNHLNYIVFWSYNEFNDWFQKQSNTNKLLDV